MGHLEILEQLGLTKKEIKIYTTLLQLGTESVFNIAKKSDIKRSTCYLILESLKNKGLVSFSKNRKSIQYSAIEPSKIYNIYKERLDQLKDAVPMLDALYSTTPNRPKFQIFEGIDGVKNVYYETHTWLEKGNEVLFYGTLENISPPLRKQLDIWKTLIRINKEAKARELLNYGVVDRKYYSEMKNVNSHYKFRFIPPELGFIHMDLIIMGNKVALIQAQKEIFAVVIESNGIADALRLLYEMAWRSAKEA